MSAVSAAATGLVLGFTLIVAIGAQNAFVLRQGLRREHVGPIVALCAACDAVLMVAGVARVDLVCPGFTSDCLETLEEINMEGRHAFLDAGGKEFHYIDCLNDQKEWIDALCGVALRHMGGWDTGQPVNAAELAASRDRAVALGAKQ